MQGLEKIGFAQDDEGYYTTHLVSDDDVLRLAVSIFGRHFHRSATINHAKTRPCSCATVWRCASTKSL